LVLADLEQGDVERAATEVEDQDELVLLALLQAVGERGRGGLVDDAEHVEARDLTGVLGRLTLGVVEVRGHRDDGVGDGLAEVGLGVLLQLAEHARRDLGRGVGLVVDLDGAVVAHVGRDRGDPAGHYGDRLALGDLTDQHLSGLAERHDGRRGARPLGVRDDGGLAALENGDHGVRGRQVDTDRSCHECCLLGRLSLDGSSLVAAAILSRNLSLTRSTPERHDLFPRPPIDLVSTSGGISVTAWRSMRRTAQAVQRTYSTTPSVVTWRDSATQACSCGAPGAGTPGARRWGLVLMVTRLM